MNNLTESDIGFLKKWSGILEEEEASKSYIHIYQSGNDSWNVTTSVHADKRAGGQELKSGLKSLDAAKKFVDELKSKEGSSYKDDKVIVNK